MDQVILFMGPPGAGKGTQCARLAERHNAVHISAGELMRQSNYASKSRVSGGDLADSRDFYALLDKTIDALPPNRMVLLDSVGKMLAEAHWLVDKMQKIGRPIAAVIFLNAPANVTIDRNLKRGRQDDSLEAQQLRVSRYKQETLPVINYYRSLGLVHEINGEGSIDEVTERIERVLA